jgi:hypothetical protein
MNISNYSKIDDLLVIINGAIITDLILISMFLKKLFSSNTLTRWYKTYGIVAVSTDILMLVIGVIITRYCYSAVFDKYTLIKLILLAIFVQNVHDYLFYKLNLLIPRNESDFMDLFKDYADEHGSIILIVDSIMITSTIIIASILANYNFNTNINIFIGSLYITPYLIYSIK